MKTEAYDPEGAREVLEKAGWVDTDGDRNPGEERTGFEYPLAERIRAVRNCRCLQSLHRQL